MAIYAVVEIAGKQYKVSEGNELLVDHLDAAQSTIFLDKVLFSVDNEKVKIGNPTVSGVLIQAQILGEEKGDKIMVVKYKAKARYRKKTGFRPLYTRIRIEKIVSAS